jgi:hypothetical protein
LVGFYKQASESVLADGGPREVIWPRICADS